MRVDVIRPSLTINVQPKNDRYEAGQLVEFAIKVTNTGDRPLQNAKLVVTGDQGMQHKDGGRIKGKARGENLPLQPGETWTEVVAFIPLQAGQRCIKVQAATDGGQQTELNSCVTVINPVPPTQSMSATLTQRQGLRRAVIGDSPVLLTAEIVNTGEVAQRNVQVTMTTEPNLRLAEATEEGQTEGNDNLATWVVPEIAPGSRVILEGLFTAVAPTPQARIAVTARSAEGTTANTDFLMEVVTATLPAAPSRDISLPPALPTPEVPGGPGTSGAAVCTSDTASWRAQRTGISGTIRAASGVVVRTRQSGRGERFDSILIADHQRFKPKRWSGIDSVPAAQRC